MCQRTRTRRVSFNAGVDREAGPGAFARGRIHRCAAWHVLKANVGGARTAKATA
jgi:hypothetical protein